jgi:hypothetical protein
LNISEQKSQWNFKSSICCNLLKYEKCECSYKKVGKTMHHQPYIKLPQNGVKILCGSCEQLVGFPLSEECRFKHKSITAELALFLLINLRLQPPVFLCRTSSCDRGIRMWVRAVDIDHRTLLMLRSLTETFFMFCWPCILVQS